MAMAELDFAKRVLPGSLIIWESQLQSILELSDCSASTRHIAISRNDFNSSQI